MLKGSVKQKLFLMISVLILVSVSAATILSDRSYRNDLIAQSTQSTRQLLEQLSINLDTYIDELFRLCLSPYYNKRVMEQLESTPATAAERLNKQRIIEDYLTEVMTLPRSDILRAYILSNGVYSSSKTRVGSALDGYSKEEWYQQALNSHTAVFLPAHHEGAGRGALEVFSVVQLTPDQIQKFSAEMSRLLRKQIKLENRVDQSLIGGIKIQVGGKMIDQSYKGDLELLRKELENQ